LIADTNQTVKSYKNSLMKWLTISVWLRTTFFSKNCLKLWIKNRIKNRLIRAIEVQSQL